MFFWTRFDEDSACSLAPEVEAVVIFKKYSTGRPVRSLRACILYSQLRYFQKSMQVRQHWSVVYYIHLYCFRSKTDIQTKSQSIYSHQQPIS